MMSNVLKLKFRGLRKGFWVETDSKHLQVESQRRRPSAGASAGTSALRVSFHARCGAVGVLYWSWYHQQKPAGFLLAYEIQNQ
jgi:hypothetical protein